jgi:hypothetical protein
VNISDDAYHNLANVTIGRGDPCRLVGMTRTDIVAMTSNAELYAKEAQLKDDGIGGWRLPTSEESNAFIAHYTWATVAPTVDIGTPWAGAYFPATAGMQENFLPAAGNRGNNTGTMLGKVQFLSSSGYYWTGSVSGADRGYALRFSGGSVSIPSSEYYELGMGIRCIRPE